MINIALLTTNTVLSPPSQCDFFFRSPSNIDLHLQQSRLREWRLRLHRWMGT